MILFALSVFPCAVIDMNLTSEEVLCKSSILTYFKFFGLFSSNENRKFSVRYQIAIILLLTANYVALFWFHRTNIELSSVTGVIVIFERNFVFETSQNSN